MSELLPSNASPLEHGLDDATARVVPVPIATSLDAQDAPVAFVPFLAHREGVTLWFDDWPEARKRQVAENWLQDYARIIGTRPAADDFLALVDASVVHRLSYPAPFVVGDVPVGSRLVNQQHHTAHFLVSVDLVEQAEALAVGAVPVGDGALAPPDDEPITRALTALRAAKSPDTEYRAHFDTRRPSSTGDRPSTSDALPVGHYRDRVELNG